MHYNKSFHYKSLIYSTLIFKFFCKLNTKNIAQVGLDDVVHEQFDSSHPSSFSAAIIRGVRTFCISKLVVYEGFVAARFCPIVHIA